MLSGRHQINKKVAKGGSVSLLRIIVGFLLPADSIEIKLQRRCFNSRTTDSVAIIILDITTPCMATAQALPLPNKLDGHRYPQLASE